MRRRLKITRKIGIKKIKKKYYKNKKKHLLVNVAQKLDVLAKQNTIEVINISNISNKNK